MTKICNRSELICSITMLSFLLKSGKELPTMSLDPMFPNWWRYKGSRTWWNWIPPEEPKDIDVSKTNKALNPFLRP